MFFGHVDTISIHFRQMLDWGTWIEMMEMVDGNGCTPTQHLLGFLEMMEMGKPVRFSRCWIGVQHGTTKNGWSCWKK